MAVDDHVDHAVLQQIFGALEAFGQLLADRVLDHALAREADQRARLRDVHVAQHRVAGGDAACRRIGEHDDVGETRLLQFGDRDGGPRHLHEREDSLLHARAARCGEDDVGRAGGDRGAHAGDEGRADSEPHRAAHEGEVLHADDRAMPDDRAASVQQRVGLVGFGARGFQAIGVFLRVAELERILAHRRHRQKLERTFVEYLPEARLRADAAVEVAFRADRLVLLPLLGEDHLPA